MIEKTIDLLGFNVVDMVTGYKGVVASVCFDLYGCVQAGVTATADEAGKLRGTEWFDIKRLKLTEGGRAMPAPNFSGKKYGSENGAVDSRPDIR